MLVLTRRPSDRILFPKLGIAIHVVRVDGRSVRLGIEAPPDVHIVRHELADEGACELPAPAPRPHGLTHEMRNRLQTALVSLHLLQRLSELGQLAPPEIESQLRDVIGQLEAMESGLDAAPRRAPSRPSPPHLSRPWRPRRTALVVEDNANERSLLAGYLQTCDYDVATANDGADALEYLATHERPDVVLLDMNMPRVGGAATVHVIRSNPDLAGVKVIAVSGIAPRQANVPLGKDGVDHWFTKPIRPDILVQELDRELAQESVTA
jgi:carbon storage regulator CsrA